MSATTSTTNGTQRTSPMDSAGARSVNTGAGDATPTALLPEPAPCGLCDGSMAELSMLLTRADEQDRSASRQLEIATDKAATQEANDRVAQLQAKADADEKQALASGVAGMAGGALTVVGGFVSSPGASNASGPCCPARGMDFHQIVNGVSGAAPHIGGLVAGQFKGDADRADANAARDEANAQADIRRYDHAHEDAQAANQSMQKVEQFLDQVQQTANATRLTAATYRG